MKVWHLLVKLNKPRSCFFHISPLAQLGWPGGLIQDQHYFACRWNYKDTPREMLLEEVALVKAIKTGIELPAFPADWGPNEKTGRIADISPGLMEALGYRDR